MKLLLLHGPALASSRLKLNQLKKTFSEDSIDQFPEGSSIQDILGSLQTISMFDQDRLIIVENPPDDLLSNSTLYALPSTLALWMDHEVSEKKEILKSINKLGGQILFFPEEKEYSIFPLLDLLGSGKKEAFLEINKRRNDTQYIITMIFYLLRSLAVPPKNAPDFVKRKIAKQRERFSEEKVKKLYKFVLEIDYKIKNGLIENDQAEFLLVNKFLS